MIIRIKPTYFGGYWVTVCEKTNDKEIKVATTFGQDLAQAHRLARFYKRVYKISDVVIETASNVADMESKING